MGRPIVYCSGCGTSLREADFEGGKASVHQDRPYCSTCRPVQAAPKPPGGAKIASSRIPVVRTPRPFPAPTARRSPVPVVAGVGAGVVLAVLLFLAVQPSPAPPPAVPPPARSPLPPIPLKPDVPAPPRPLPPPPPPPVVALPQLDDFLAQIREVLQAPNLPQRQAEIESMLGNAEKRAGERKADVDALREELVRRLRDGALLVGLVGHWPMDEAEGDRVPDVGGHGHHARAVGGPEWVDGRRGRALRFAGREDHVVLPSAPPLNTLQEGDFTVAMWLRREDVPSEAGDAKLPGAALFMKRGQHAGVSLGDGPRVYVHLWFDKAESPSAMASTPAPERGRWWHCAVTVDRSTGQIRIFIDGRPANGGRFPTDVPVRDYRSEPWRIGAAAPGHPKYAFPFRGAVDDVRVWSRALTAEEIRLLAEAP